MKSELKRKSQCLLYPDTSQAVWLLVQKMILASKIPSPNETIYIHLMLMNLLTSVGHTYKAKEAIAYYHTL